MSEEGQGMILVAMLVLIAYMLVSTGTTLGDGQGHISMYKFKYQVEQIKQNPSIFK